VSPGRRESRAAKELCDRLYGVTPREIERWRQDYGLISPTIRRWIPRGGSESVYPPEAEIQARQVRALLDEGFDLADVAVVQWVRGNYVETERLRRVLVLKIRERLGPPPAAPQWHTAKPDAEARAQRAAQRLAREKEAKQLREEIYRAARRPGERVNETLKRLLTSIYLTYSSGEPFTRKDLIDFLGGVGLPNEPADAARIAEHLPAITQVNLEEVIRSSTRAELDQAVQDTFALAKAVKRLGLKYVEVAERDMVMPVIGTLALRRRFADVFDTALESDTPVLEESDDPNS
jgi:hypothetical protein